MMTITKSKQAQKTQVGGAFLRIRCKHYGETNMGDEYPDASLVWDLESQWHAYYL